MNAASRPSCGNWLLSGIVSGIIFSVFLIFNSWGDEATLPESDAAEIERLVERLGSSAFDERESALNKLRQIGPPARSILWKARHHKSAEVRSRVVTLIRKFDAIPMSDAFQKFAKQPDEKVDLEEGMCLIARILNKDMQRIRVARQLDALADAVRKKLGNDTAPKSIDPERLVNVLCEVIFEDERFGGNFDDYSNPSNSSIEAVLETKRGLPILVSHVVTAVGRRLDVPIVGLPTSGRYIVKYDGTRAPSQFPTADIFFDPYNNGKILSRDDRATLFPTSDPDKLVSAQSPRKDLIRMLNNLESHLFNRDEVDRAYQALEFRVQLEQNDPMPRELP